MAAEIEEYQAALKAHETAIATCERNANLIHRASKILNNWKQAIVSNADLGFPAELILVAGTPSIDAAQWPTARQIGADMAAYHSTKSAARQAHARIPEAQRAVVMPPPQ